jgi:hypothetical protein
MPEFCLQSVFSLPTDVILYIFSFEPRVLYKNGKYIYESKIPKTDERYDILSKRLLVIKAFQRSDGVRFFPTTVHHIAIYDDDKDLMSFSLELEKTIKLYKTMYW